MPTYQYACTECGERLEVVQKFTDEPLTVCPACRGRLRKLFSPVGVVFKGSGFYKTDSRATTAKSGTTGGKDGAGAGKEAAAASKEGSGASEVKPAAASADSSSASSSSAGDSSTGTTPGGGGSKVA